MPLLLYFGQHASTLHTITNTSCSRQGFVMISIFEKCSNLEHLLRLDTPLSPNQQSCIGNCVSKPTECIPCGTRRELPMPRHHQGTPDISVNHSCVDRRSRHFPCYYRHTAARSFHSPVCNSLKHGNRNFSAFKTLHLPNNNAHNTNCISTDFHNKITTHLQYQ